MNVCCEPCGSVGAQGDLQLELFDAEAEALDVLPQHHAIVLALHSSVLRHVAVWQQNRK